MSTDNNEEIDKDLEELNNIIEDSIKLNNIKELKLNSKVKIKPTSGYYGLHHIYNPKDTMGKVIKFEKVNYDGHHNIRVEWATGHCNNYEESDLELI